MNATMLSSSGSPPQLLMLPVPSPTDLLKGLPEEYREALLAELLAQKMLAERDRSIFPIAADGREIGVFLRSDSHSATADAMYAQLDPATRANVMKPFVEFDWENFATEEEIASAGGR